MRGLLKLTPAAKHRRGAVLVWFAVFLFALIPLITLVMHSGMVTLSRRQMQTAVNSAAIEGLRFRDAPTLTETQRRQQVSDLVSAVYDDNLDSGDGDAMNFGAGSVVTFDDEPTDIELPGTDFKASRMIRPENIGVYQPQLKLNLDNEPYGDMVSGGAVTGGSHSETDDYSRDDFNTLGNDAFLVRLRRTDGSNPHDEEMGVSSHGPTVAYLFGRAAYGPDGPHDPRERGSIVRATAIAQASPAMTVGRSSPSVPLLEGVAPLWIQLSSWNSWTLGNVASVIITSSAITGDLNGETVTEQVVSVGDQLIPVPPATFSLIGERYIPIYTELPSGQKRVIGFGIGQLNLIQTGGTITPQPSKIGARNASVKWAADLSTLSPADLAALLGVRGIQNHGLLAPALQRSIPLP